MHVVVLGFSQWALPTITGAVTDADVTVVTYEESASRARPSPWVSLSEFCSAAGIPVITDTWPPQYRWRKDISADLLISSNWRHRLPGSVWTGWTLPALNVHRSLLPAYRGASPLNWAVARGEKRTGVTIHEIDEQLDSGAIVAQGELPIDESETATSVFGRANLLVETLVRQTVRRAKDGDLDSHPQPQADGVLFRSRTPGDLAINWTRPRRDVFNLIRAQSAPFPNATACLGAKTVYIDRVHMVDGEFAGSPGLVVSAKDDGGVVVLCGETGRGVDRALKVESMRRSDVAASRPGDLIREGKVLGNGRG